MLVLASMRPYGYTYIAFTIDIFEDNLSPTFVS